MNGNFKKFLDVIFVHVGKLKHQDLLELDIGIMVKKDCTIIKISNSDLIEILNQRTQTPIALSIQFNSQKLIPTQTHTPTPTRKHIFSL